MILYSDIDPKCCAWITELIRAGEIPHGDVWCKPIQEIKADELTKYHQVHLFAGIAGWARAAQLAGLAADDEYDSCSCPCPPFSTAAKKKVCPVCSGRPFPCPWLTGYFTCSECDHSWPADSRHLWPEAWRLIAQRRPPVVYGEQVSSDDGRIWLAGVCATLAQVGYDTWGIDTCSAGVAAPNLRQRIFWVAHREGDGREQECADGRRSTEGTGAEGRTTGLELRGPTGGLACPNSSERGRVTDGKGGEQHGSEAGWKQSDSELKSGCPTGGVSDAPECGCRNGVRGPIGADENRADACRCDGAQRLDSSNRSRCDGAESDSESQTRDEARMRLPGTGCAVGGVGNPDDQRSQGFGERGDGPGERTVGADGVGLGTPGTARREQADQPGDTGRDFWAHFDIIPCGDGKKRRAEPGVKPLVDGVPGGLVPSGDPGAPIGQEPAREVTETEANATAEARITRLRGYGNAINPYVAARFILATLPHLHVRVEPEPARTCRIFNFDEA